jgi:nucleoid DNA-binding protein
MPSKKTTDEPGPEWQRKPPTLTRDELSRAVSAHAPGVDHAAARALVDVVVGEIVAALRMHGDVTVPSLGRFRVKRTPATRRRNPRTGETIDCPARDRVRFKPSKWLEGRCFDA